MCRPEGLMNLVISIFLKGDTNCTRGAKYARGNPASFKNCATAT